MALVVVVVLLWVGCGRCNSSSRTSSSVVAVLYCNIVAQILVFAMYIQFGGIYTLHEYHFILLYTSGVSGVTETHCKQMISL